jgi:beta-glucosidase
MAERRPTTHGERALYKDPDRPMDERVEDLLGRMTLEEKVAQTLCVHVQPDWVDDEGRLRKRTFGSLLRHGVGELGTPNESLGRGPEESARLVNQLQRYAIEKSRLGIPAIMHEECLHGLWARGATIFPQVSGMASTWDPQLIGRVFSAIALETRSRGGTQALTPNIDVCREPRFGRVEESYGEDPYLVSRFAVAVVRGLQGSGPRIDDEHIAATVKHFAAYGEPLGGINKAPPPGGARRLREVYLPSFRAAVTEAGAMSVMASYNEIDGIPSHANEWLLTDLLRGEWGFEGYVMSDASGVEDLVLQHRVAASMSDAGRRALLAGVDLELANPRCFPALEELVRAGRVPLSVLDQSVRRVLRGKFLLGLFEKPYADPEKAKRVNRCVEHRALALDAARKSIVLLKNKRRLLPLNDRKIKRLAVIGPNAATLRVGGYSIRNPHGVSILEGIRARVRDSVEVHHAEGCRIHSGSDYWIPEPMTGKRLRLNDPKHDAAMIEEAVAVARRCDVAVVVVGETPLTCGEFIGHSSTLELVGRQNELVESVRATGMPLVVCLVNGRPLALSGIAETADALLECWYPGEQSGVAVADVLFGDVNPSGKLPFSFPRSVGHVPAYYNARLPPDARYLLSEATPLFPFGFGLSYTTFAYSKPRVTPEKIGSDGSAVVRVDITNTGKRAGDEVVQLYVRDLVCSVTRPPRALGGFARVHLEPGETRTVELEVGFDQLACYDRAMRETVESGDFELLVGPDSATLQSTRLTVEERP